MKVKHLSLHQIIDEFKASQEGREFGDTKPESERTTALSSGQVAN